MVSQVTRPEPDHVSYLANRLCTNGEDQEIKTSSTQKHLHLNGAFPVRSCCLHFLNPYPPFRSKYLSVYITGIQMELK